MILPFITWVIEITFTLNSSFLQQHYKPKELHCYPDLRSQNEHVTSIFIAAISSTFTPINGVPGCSKQRPPRKQYIEVCMRAHVWVIWASTCYKSAHAPIRDDKILRLFATFQTRPSVVQTHRVSHDLLCVRFGSHDSVNLFLIN